MSEYIINGKKVSKEDALKWIEKAEKITHFSALHEREGDKGELSHEGFAIDQSFISSMSKGMDEHQAGYLRVSFLGSSKIMGRNLYIVMTDPDAVPKWKRWVLNVLERII